MCGLLIVSTGEAGTKSAAKDNKQYIDSLPKYFRFCHDDCRAIGHRCNITNVSCRIAHDKSSLFSYPLHGGVIKFAPASIDTPGWEAALIANKALGSQHHGTRPCNQTTLLIRDQIRETFGDRREIFERFRRQFDPRGRLVSPYFRARLGSA